MTLMETAQLLGNLGEFVGAIAVVATLAYLTLQVRQNSKIVEATVRNANTRSRNELNVAIATNPELSETLLAGVQDYKSLSLEQRQRFNAWVNAILINYEDLYIHELKGFAVTGQWESSRNFLTGFFANENMKRWWKERGAPAVAPQFQLEMEKSLGI